MLQTTRFTFRAYALAATAFLFGLILAAAVTYWVGGRGDRTVTFLAINDTYRLEGIAEGKSGGLTRVRTLRSWIERDAPNAILLHAGDFLSPSLESKVFKGAQIIDVMNGLGGDTGAFDNRMFAAFGNHEFDDSRCDRTDPPLNARVAESRFTWLAANLDFPHCAGMKGIADLKNVKKDVVIEVDNVRVGLFGIGLTPDKASAPKYPPFEEALPAARRSVENLRKAGAELIVGLTHLPREDDQTLLRELAGSGLDLLVGGHDHNSMVLFDDNGQARGFKADSDARTAWRIDVELPKGSRPRVHAQLITLNEAILHDPALAQTAQSWSARAEQKICADRGAAKPDCLKERIGRTQTSIELEENLNRAHETGFGDWLADLLAKETGADVAIVNSGILGLNEDLAPGTALLLRHVVDIFRFDDVVAVRSLPARQVCAAMAHGFSAPGMGAWPHVGGVEVDVLLAQGKTPAASVTRFRGKPGITCDSDEPIKVASVPFVLCSGDGYRLLPSSDKCITELQARPFDDDRKGVPLSKLAEKAIRDAGDAGIAPRKDGRVRFIEAGAGQ